MGLADHHHDLHVWKKSRYVEESENVLKNTSELWVRVRAAAPASPLGEKGRLRRQLDCSRGGTGSYSRRATVSAPASPPPGQGTPPGQPHSPVSPEKMPERLTSDPGFQIANADRPHGPPENAVALGTPPVAVVHGWFYGGTPGLLLPMIADDWSRTNVTDEWCHEIAGTKEMANSEKSRNDDARHGRRLDAFGAAAPASFLCSLHLLCATGGVPCPGGGDAGAETVARRE